MGQYFTEIFLTQTDVRDVLTKMPEMQGLELHIFSLLCIDLTTVKW